MAIRRVLRGIGALLRWIMGQSPTQLEDDALDRVDYVILILVGVGLVFVLLYLLRR